MAERSLNGMPFANNALYHKVTKERLEKTKKKPAEYLVWTIVKSDSEIDRDEVVVSMAEVQKNWQVSKAKEIKQG
jgi:hypothetical protein